MIWVPGDAILNATAHTGLLARLAAHHRLLALFVVRYGGLVLTLLGTLFLFAVRLAGGPVAAFFERSFGLISKNLGQSVGHKIRMFHSGLDTMRSFRDFAVVVGLSLSMWMLICFAYFETCRAFTASPELAGITVSKCVLLMVASGTASIIQLPVIGWFSQIGLVVVALTGILGANAEAATACAATLLLVTFLGIVPVGLIWARFDHVSLRKVTTESEQAEERRKKVWRQARLQSTLIPESVDKDRRSNRVLMRPISRSGRGWRVCFAFRLGQIANRLRSHCSAGHDHAHRLFHGQVGLDDAVRWAESAGRPKWG